MHDASRRVLYLLETVEVLLRSSVQEAVAIIDPSYLAPIMAVAIDFADSKVSDGRRCRNDRRWKLHARTTLVTC